MAGFGLESPRAILDRPAAARRLVTVGAGCAAAALLCALTRWLSGEAGYRYFLTFYPQNDYLLPIARSAWNDTGRALFSLTGLLVLFCAFAAAAARRLIRGPVAAAIFFCIVFVDLAALGKPADPCLPHAALARPTGTGAFLKQDPSLFRIYSFGPAQTQRSFLHVYALPFDRVYRMIRETLQENTNIYEGIHSAGEYSDLLLTRYYEIFAPAEQCLREARPDPAAAASGAAILSLLNVKYIVSPFALDAFPFRRVRSGPVNVYENPAVMPRAFATHRVTVLNSDEDVLERMRRSDYRPSETVYLTAGECARAPAACALGADNASEATVTIRDYRPGTVTMSAITGKPAMLVLADTYYPGWKAFVDGKERPVLRVNHTLRGVALEPGGHTVVFVFQPASLVWGAWLSLGASLVCGAAFVFSRRRRAFV